ncbi:hypothetical protein [Niastella sp. OAS944]|uniref:hypothetical protein n=1 Tax=Niastella sp. OAS944 TaxID=2664089 RepID=UPI00348F3F24|nr:hypothetical protein [Chitinophagaceae bacterium OAS944]
MANNPVKNIDFLGDTTIYYAMGTSRTIGQINNSGGIQRIQVSEQAWDIFNEVLGEEGTSISEINENVVCANYTVDRFNGALDIAENIYGSRGGGRELISRETGELSLAFEGDVNSKNPKMQ